MKLIAALILMPGFALLTWSAPALAEEEYRQPYPHATGAQLLPYCQQTAVVVDRLRCDYYVQGLADLASTPVRGERLACPPQGLNRTELMELATEYLSSLRPDELENSSAASLILKGLQKKFRCPKSGGDKGKKAGKPGMAQSVRQAMSRKAAKAKEAANK